MLFFDKTKRKFTLKKTDKHKSSLRSLAPKNKTKSINKQKIKSKKLKTNKFILIR